MTGSGTELDPYVIWDVTDLQSMKDDLNAYYELGQDIDASATTTWNWDAGRSVYEGFAPVGTFAGDFDGKYYKITDLYINRDFDGSNAYVGLFSNLSGTATSVYILDADIKVYQSSSYTILAGILAGLIQNDIERIFTSGSVYAEWTSTHSVVNGVGGVVGQSEYAASLSQCVSLADIEFVHTQNDEVRVGGLIGWHGGGSEVLNCYARGSVTADSGTATMSSIGGFAGVSYEATITNVYSTGLITTGASFPDDRSGGLVGVDYLDTCNNNFWDTTTSGEVDSACGTGKSTTYMTAISTFTDAGWDFDTIWSSL